MSTPFITVMILCYNYGHLLPRALDAIAKQKFADFEILMIDNGSIDDSKQIFEDFCKTHSELNTRYLLVSPNQGPAHGWNMGMKEARGQYVMFCDEDDWMEPDCLEVLAAAAQKTSADRIAGQYQEVLPDGTVQKVRKVFPKAGKKFCGATLQGVMFRRSVIIENRIVLPENILGPYDYYMTFLFACFERTIPVFLETTIYNYLVNPISICRTCEGKNEDENEYLTYYQCIDKPMIDFTCSCLPAAKDNDLRQAIVHAAVHTLYADIVRNYFYMNAEHAQEIYRLLKAGMRQAFPGYQKNRYLFPHKNGYEFLASFAIWCVVKAEVLGCAEIFLRAAGKILYRRKKETYA